MIRKMLKWAVIGTVAVGAAGFAMFGRNFTSYFGTAARSLRDGVAESIPLEFELKRARNLIREIDPQLHDARRELAQAEVDLESAESDVVRLEKEVQHGERKLRAVSASFDAASLDGNAPVIRLASHDRTRVEIDLERTFEVFKNNRALLEGKRSLIERQQRAVAAARLRLDAVRNEKTRLEEMVGSLTTQKRQLDALAASSKTIELDDSALGRARDVLDQVKRRLDVAQRMLEDEVFASPTDGSPRRDIVGEIQRYFGDDEGVETAASANGAVAPIRVEIR